MKDDTILEPQPPHNLTGTLTTIVTVYCIIIPLPPGYVKI